MHAARPLPRAAYICTSCTQRAATGLHSRTRKHVSTLAVRRLSTANRLQSLPLRSTLTRDNTLRPYVPATQNAYSTATANRKKPLRLAIIGSGPAGFYTAYRLMNKIQDAIVDMYEQLPVPYGLVRFGVAPDHPDVKNCQDTFEQVAQSPRFNYIGNVRIGYDIDLAKLKPHYDAMLFSYGASEDRKLGIPGEHLEGVFSAREFVGWYNGLPQFQDLKPQLKTGEQAVVIGQGNVAMDVARMLLTPVDTLRSTDITEQAIQTLSESKIRSVRVVGRRGPIQAGHSYQIQNILINVDPGCLHSQRSTRIDAYSIRCFRTRRQILVPTQCQEARADTKENCRCITQRNT